MIRENVLGHAICGHMIDHVFNRVDIRTKISRSPHEINFSHQLGRHGNFVTPGTCVPAALDP
jgi:hypothetical protein